MGDHYAAQLGGVGFHSFPGEGAAPWQAAINCFKIHFFLSSYLSASFFLFDISAFPPFSPSTLHSLIPSQKLSINTF
jgi:hypothetical protein